MRSQIATVIVILTAGSGVALATNLLRNPPLDLIRGELPPIPPKPDPTPRPDGTAREKGKPHTGPTADEVIAHLKDGTARFIDARETKEFAAGHLRGAINLPSSAIYDHIEAVYHQVQPNDKVIVYCGGGDCEASHNVADALRRDFQYKDVTIYVTGWEGVEKVEGFKPFVVIGAES
jgi:3-mercaptopyruvate sulfurtransferase SseA